MLARWLEIIDAWATAENGDDVEVEGEFDAEWGTASIVSEILRAFEKETGLYLEKETDNPAFSPILMGLGGAEYVRAVKEWDNALVTWERSRKREKGSAPPAPRIPG